jgi:ADP-ribose pyrophosphatase YjhB (NUDIX family)
MRYCPHCTHILEERFAFDRMRLTCPACSFVHFQGPKVGVSVLIERDGQVLLVQRAIDPGRSLWCLPSGFVEWDEAPEAAASRECQEETGLAVTGLELLSAKQYTDDFRGPGINIAYIARAAEGTASPGDDAMAVRWFAPEDLPPRGQIAFNSHAALLMTWRQSLPARSGG